MSLELLVTGGYFDSSGECFVDRVSPGSTPARVVSFVPPPPHSVETKGFTGAAWCDQGTLLACSFDAVWRIDVGSGAVTGRLHQPDFNDLHGVSVDREDGTIFVANTGLDAVEVFEPGGSFAGRHAMTPAWFEAERQSGLAVAREDLPSVLRAGWGPSPLPPRVVASGGYYGRGDAEPFHRRKVRDYAHPNHVVRAGCHLIATLLSRSELRCVRTWRRIAAVDGHPHDGVLAGGRLWFTTIDGRVFHVDPAGGSPELVIDTGLSGYHGWCRGLAVGGGLIAVGLTAMRSVSRYAWRDVPPERTETSVLWFDLATRGLVGRVDLSDRARHSKIFSLLPARIEGP